MEAIIEFMTPVKKERAAVEIKENVQENNIEKNPVKSKILGNRVRKNLVRAPTNNKKLEPKKNADKKRAPRNLLREPKKPLEQIRGRSKTKKKHTYGYLRTTQSFLGKRCSKSKDKREEQKVVASVATSRPRGVTKPKSMKLQTRIRSRFSSRQPLSQTDRDELFMKSLKPFKAREVSARIMQSSGDLGIPKVAKRPITKTREFKFRTSIRATSRAQSLSKSIVSNSSTTSLPHPKKSMVPTLRRDRYPKKPIKPEASLFTSKNFFKSSQF